MASTDTSSLRPRLQAHEMHYAIQARLTDAGNILIDTKHNDLDGIMRSVSRKLVDMENEAVRAALVELGWTPPATSPIDVRTPYQIQIAALTRSLTSTDHNILCAALRNLGWDKLGRGVWMEPEKA